LIFGAEFDEVFFFFSLRLSLTTKKKGKKRRRRSKSLPPPPRHPLVAPFSSIQHHHGLAPHDVGIHDLDTLLRRARHGSESAFSWKESREFPSTKQAATRFKRLFFCTSRRRCLRARRISPTMTQHRATSMRGLGVFRTNGNGQLADGRAHRNVAARRCSVCFLTWHLTFSILSILSLSLSFYYNSRSPYSPPAARSSSRHPSL
jgi:hypothetical protein